MSINKGTGYNAGQSAGINQTAINNTVPVTQTAINNTGYANQYAQNNQGY